jgi:serine/threonine protein kinase
MAVPLEEFVKRLEESGIVSSTTIKGFIPPKANPKGAEDLAFQLVKNRKLTKYQAAVVYSGNAKSLVLGNYILLEKIGAGGMGQVFKARHQRMDRVVAIKLLSPAMSKDPDAIARFEREVRAAAKLSHPNIVAAHDADCADGYHFLVMEYVDGSDLAAVIKKTGTLPVDKAVDYIMQAAVGLEAAHKKGIVHRDIKPSNLLLDGEGNIKILDMGLAILKFEEADSDVQQDDLTTVGKIMGTVDFMSPEQALNTHTADNRTDIYALGCSLYYVLTGKSMYTGNSPMEKLMAHRIRPIPSLCAARPDATPQLEAVYKKMVAKKVGDRYQSATEVIAALKECIDPQTNSKSVTKTSVSLLDDEFPDFDLEELSSEDLIMPKPSGSSKNFQKSPAGKSPSGSGRIKNTPSSGKVKSSKSVNAKAKDQLPAGNGSQWQMALVVGGVLAILVLTAGLLMMRAGTTTAQSSGQTSHSNEATADASNAAGNNNSTTPQKSKAMRVNQSEAVIKVGPGTKVHQADE